MSQQILSLPLEKKIGQLFFIGIGGVELDESSRRLIEEISPGGVCLFSRNIRRADQTRSLLDEIRESVAVEPFLSLDQEGGLVDRLRRVFEPMPAASALKTKEDAARLAGITAEAIRILGFNMNFAPVLDVIDHKRARAGNGLYSRAFGNSREEAAQFAVAYLEKLSENDCLGCVKHFPGLGASEVDSHEELPKVSISSAELFDTDLYPYREIFQTFEPAAVMIGHAAYPASNLQETDRNGKLLPSSLSFNFTTKLLREELGFRGIAVTDDLEMGAILNNYGIGEACKMAVKAGEDMLAVCAVEEKIREGYRAVLEAVRSGEIDEARIDQSIERIERAKNLIHSPLPYEERRLRELSAEVVELKERINL